MYLPPPRPAEASSIEKQKEDDPEDELDGSDIEILEPESSEDADMQKALAMSRKDMCEENAEMQRALALSKEEIGSAPGVVDYQDEEMPRPCGEVLMKLAVIRHCLVWMPPPPANCLCRNYAR
jgi:hypothetical protein